MLKKLLTCVYSTRALPHRLGQTTKMMPALGTLCTWLAGTWHLTKHIREASSMGGRFSTFYVTRRPFDGTFTVLVVVPSEACFIKTIRQTSTLAFT